MTLLLFVFMAFLGWSGWIASLFIANTPGCESMIFTHMRETHEKIARKASFGWYGRLERSVIVEDF